MFLHQLGVEISCSIDCISSTENEITSSNALDNAKEKHYVRWRCKTRITKGVCQCDAHSIPEKELQNHIIRAINKLLGNRTSILKFLKDDVTTVLFDDKRSLNGIDSRIKILQKELEVCIHLNKDYEHITTELDELLVLKNKVQLENDNSEGIQNRVEELNEFIQAQTTILDYFDEGIVRKIVSTVVVGDSTIEVIFKTGDSIKMKKYIQKGVL
ncbi:recombinase zinc beta ribbon domain-containing protein [Aerococcaceae bacterium NML201296]|nr:recombinase zinc beta ribbon domain-containing protein [Aerococcaceae bacterium NML201296]